MLPEPAFPCSCLTADSRLLKLSGVYGQRQNGLYMQRIKIQGGKLEPAGWQRLAELARRHTPGAPLLLTMRQCIEFHNIPAGRLPVLQQELATAGFTGLGACGDTLRNITLCPGNGLCPESVDLSAAANEVRRTLENFKDVFTLPRKFKISFSGCARGCAQPYINDLGFIAQVRATGVTVKLIGAGSLGARPETGIELADNVQPEYIPALALAALRLFHARGNRVNRHKARLRHVRQELGDEAFLALFKKECQACEALLPPGPPAMLSGPGMRRACELNVPCGLLRPDQADALAGILTQTQACARIQNHHRISIFAPDTGSVLAAFRESPLLRPLLEGPDIASCPGTAFCVHAIVNTHAAETALRAQLPPDFAVPVRISGCPNGCSHATIAPIGLSGRLKRGPNGQAREGFQVLSGGRMGLEPGCGTTVSSFVPTEELAGFIQHMPVHIRRQKA